MAIPNSRFGRRNAVVNAAISRPGMSRGQFLRTAGVGAAGVAAAGLGLSGSARAVSTTVIGQKNPAYDVGAITLALLNYQTVYLQGTFDLGSNMYVLVPSNYLCKEIIGQGAVVRNGVYGFLVFYNNGVTIKNIRFENQAGGRPLVLFGSSNCMFDGNVIVNSSPGYGITLRSGAVGNIISNNDLTGLASKFSYNPVTGAYSEGAHIEILNSNSKNNLVTNNLIGHVSSSSPAAGIFCGGESNQIVNNEFGNSGIMGLKYGTQVCVLLGSQSQYNTVFEQGNYPTGTGGAKEQVVDLPRELTGTTTNRVIGHSADYLAEGIKPGIGKIMRDLEARMDAQAALENQKLLSSLQ